jgi:nucleoside-triphosphatase THEP1
MEGNLLGELRSGRDVKNANIADSDMLADKVEVDLHVLRALMLHEINGEIDRADVVAIDKGGTHEGAMELMKKLTELENLGHVIGHIVILGLSAGERDDELSLRGPRDEVGA